jgi:hypothetical protein
MKLKKGEVAVPMWRGSGKYMVTNLGRVYSLYVNRFLFPPVNPTGYRRFFIKFKGRMMNISIHRAVRQSFDKTNKSKMQVAHLDGDKLNNKLNNLAWVTNKENCAHKLLHGRSARGENHPHCKISEKTAKCIWNCEPFRDDIGLADIAKMFKTTKGIVRNIWNGYTWNHITKLPKRSRILGGTK